MIITEAFYLCVVIALFFFMIDEPSRYVKMFFGFTILVATLSIVLTSLIMTIYLAVKGPRKLKMDDKISKLRRAEKEALERAKKEERKLKLRKEQEARRNFAVELGSNIQSKNNNTTLSELKSNERIQPKIRTKAERTKKT